MCEARGIASKKKDEILIFENLGLRVAISAVP